MMNGHGKSDGSIVPKKPANKADEAAEWVEGRDLTKGSSSEQTTRRTQSRESVSNALGRTRQVSKKEKRTSFTSLFHHICSPEALLTAYYGLKRSAAPGVDGQTWDAYGTNLEANLLDLSNRLKRGAYRPKPVRRVFIPKADGSTRPIGVTTIEDKVVQSATVAVLNAVYEPLFAGFSYGFRPGRGQHHALDAAHVAITKRRVNWVLDADIRSFFDTINHECLTRFIERKIRDPRVVRLVQKWLKAGILSEEGRIKTGEGAPQGGSVSPVLANIYLHYVYDCWAAKWRKEKAKGDAVFVGYADDTVAGFQYYREARGFLAELRSNLRTVGLELHPEKTRILEFGKFASKSRLERGKRKPETFEFLGFTHICGKDRRGVYQLLRRTSRKRMTRKLQELKAQLRERMHHQIPEVGKWLHTVVRGHNQYFGVPFNLRSLRAFRNRLIRFWYMTLRRRSQKSTLTWDKMYKLAKRWLPLPKITHPFPDKRLVV